MYQEPYLKGYETPNFILLDDRKGSPKEHISQFLDALGQHAGDRNLRLCEFSKSHMGRAYNWYTILAPRTIHTWDEMVGKFCKKYFQNEEKVTTIMLSNTQQNQGENLVDYVHRIWDLALDYCDSDDEVALVGICINNIISKYRVYLENIGIK